jgi:hypothetical protein
MLKNYLFGECILVTVIRLESMCVRTLRAAQNWNLRAAAHPSALDLSEKLVAL